MTLLVRDEQDIVRENLDFHLAQGVERVIVTDNGSEDRTLEILRSYEARGLVRLLLEPTPARAIDYKAPVGRVRALLWGD